MKRWIWVVLILLLAGVSGWRIWKLGKDSGNQKQAKADYAVYVNNNAKYQINIPSDWLKQEATPGGIFVSRVEWQPTENSIKLGDVGEISVTITATGSADLLFSTQKEFDFWNLQPDKASNSGIFKLGSGSLSGIDAVKLGEVEDIPDDSVNKFWSETAWIRKDNRNYYINMMGNGPADWATQPTFDWMLSTFKILD